MKKNGFTLAEVLITLTIIGVIAALTLPSLMANTAEQQARTAVRKIANTMTMAAHLNATLATYDYSGITKASPTTDGTAAEEGSMTWLLQERTAHQALKWAKPTAGGGVPAIVDTAVYFNDGTAVYFKNNTLSANADVVTHGYPVIFDINGAKGPNLLSSCTSAATVSAWAGDDAGDCSDKKKRFIKDQFMFRLRETTVTPIGAVSAFMFDETHKAPTADEKY